MPLRALFLMGTVLLGSLCLASTALAADVTINGVVYATNNSLATASVTGHTPDLPSDVTIPSTIMSIGAVYNVTSIGSGAFSYATGLESVTIPDSVTTIGTTAFQGTASLRSITLPTNSEFVSIERATFQQSGLTSIAIPNSVTSIGSAAFQQATSLRTITIGSGVTSIGFDAFRANQEEVCRTVIEGRDALLVMPTGAGKSLCYQLPGLARGGERRLVHFPHRQQRLDRLQLAHHLGEAGELGPLHKGNRDLCACVCSHA